MAARYDMDSLIGGSGIASRRRGVAGEAEFDVESYAGECEF